MLRARSGPASPEGANVRWQHKLWDSKREQGREREGEGEGEREGERERQRQRERQRINLRKALNQSTASLFTEQRTEQYQR